MSDTAVMTPTMLMAKGRRLARAIGKKEGPATRKRAVSTARVYRPPPARLAGGASDYGYTIVTSASPGLAARGEAA